MIRYPPVRELVEGLLKIDIKQRLKSFKDIKATQWFEGVNWGIIEKMETISPISIYLNKTYIHEEFLR